VPPSADADLTEGMRVHLDIGDGNVAIPCIVLAFFGAVIVARHDARLDDETTQRLVGGAAAYVLVERAGGVKALRVRARATGAQTLALQITDSFQLGQRRESTRIALALSARLVPQCVDPVPISTRTIDVSLGGVQVQRTPAMPICPDYELTLLGDALADPVVAQVTLARELPDGLGLRFTHIQTSDRQRLIGLVLSHVTERSAS
jgi:hypothetical protein